MMTGNPRTAEVRNPSWAMPGDKFSVVGVTALEAVEIGVELANMLHTTTHVDRVEGTGMATVFGRVGYTQRRRCVDLAVEQIAPAAVVVWSTKAEVAAAELRAAVLSEPNFHGMAL